MVETATVTSKGQVTIPVNLRRELEITEGTRVIMIREGKMLKLIPIPKLSKLAGIDEEVFKGRKPSKEIEETRRKWTEDFERRIKEI